MPGLLLIIQWLCHSAGICSAMGKHSYKQIVTE